MKQATAGSQTAYQQLSNYFRAYANCISISLFYPHVVKKQKYKSAHDANTYRPNCKQIVLHKMLPTFKLSHLLNTRTVTNKDLTWKSLAVSCINTTREPYATNNLLFIFSCIAHLNIAMQTAKLILWSLFFLILFVLMIVKKGHYGCVHTMRACVCVQSKPVWVQVLIPAYQESHLIPPV